MLDFPYNAFFLGSQWLDLQKMFGFILEIYISFQCHTQFFNLQKIIGFRFINEYTISTSHVFFQCSGPIVLGWKTVSIEMPKTWKNFNINRNHAESIIIVHQNLKPMPLYNYILFFLFELIEWSGGLEFYITNFFSIRPACI